GIRDKLVTGVQTCALPIWLKAGMYDAATAASGMRLVSFTPKPAPFDTVRGLTFVNSDLAFRGNYVYQGNFAGFSIWDVSNPSKRSEERRVGKECRSVWSRE